MKVLHCAVGFFVVGAMLGCYSGRQGRKLSPMVKSHNITVRSKGSDREAKSSGTGIGSVHLYQNKL